METVQQKRDFMTGTTRSSADLDPRRRRILVRAWRRGIREMDLVIGGFADAEIGRAQ
jgi:antitoxin CptB